MQAHLFSAKFIVPVITGLIALAGANAAVAKDRHHKHQAKAEAFYDYAPVTGVSPVYREVPIRKTVWECTEQPRHHRHRAHRHRSYTPESAGGIVGGVVGNQFGRGRGKTLLTVAGAALGVSVGHDINQRMLAERHSWHRGRERCYSREQVHMERELMHYRVEYRYRGQEFVTRTATDPGRRIRVRVGVSPAESRDQHVVLTQGNHDCRNCEESWDF